MPDIRLSRLASVLLIAIFSLGLVSPVSAQSPGTDDADLLAPRQTIEIRIGQWDPIEESYTAWEDLGGSVMIAQDGSVSLPMVGTIPAAGLTPDQLGGVIAQRLRDRAGLQGAVEASVRIAAYQPIYVTGDVRAPGTYPYFPGMTVIQALGQAGGIDNPGPALLRGDRGALSSLGAYRVLELDLQRRLATIARLRAEMDDTEMQTPDEIFDATLGAELMAREAEILEARRASLDSSLSQLDDLETLLAEQITRLTRQLALRDQQLILLEGELENRSSLVERGLSTASAESALERQVADQQVRSLEVETARLNAQQRLNETRRDRLDLVNNRRLGLVEGLQNQTAAINDLRARMETEAALFAESRRTGTGIARIDEETVADLTVSRQGDDGARTLNVAQSDAIRGGDVLDVRLNTPGLDALDVQRIEGVGGSDLPRDLLNLPPT